MQVQLHALDLGGVHAALVRDLGHVARVELHIVPIVGQLHRARDAQPHSNGDAVAQRRDLALKHPLAHDDRAIVIGHFNERQPHSRLAQLAELTLEDLALDHNTARLGGQLAHRHGMALDLAAHDDLAGGRLLFCAAAAGGTLLLLGKAALCERNAHAVERKAIRQKLLEQRTLRVRDLLQHRQRKVHRAALLLHDHVSHAGVGEQHAQADGRRKALK